MLLGRLGIFVLARSPRKIVRFYYGILRCLIKVDSIIQDIWDKPLKRLTSIILHLPIISEDAVDSKAEFEAALAATKNSIGLILFSIVAVWTLDRIADYSLANVVYGLAVTGSAGLIASGTNLFSIDERLLNTDVLHEHSELYSAVNRIISFLSFGIGIYAQISIHFLNEVGLPTWIPVPDAHTFDLIYWSIIIFSVLLSSVIYLIEVFLEPIIITTFSVVIFYLINTFLAINIAISVSLSIIAMYELSILITYFGIPVLRGLKRIIGGIFTPHEMEKAEL